MEFTQLQDRIKMEQEMNLEFPNALTPLDYPPSTRYSINSDSHPFSPDSTISSHEIKPEPLDLMDVKPPTQDSDNVLLKQCLSDKSFQTKYNLKPVNFGVGLTGFVSDASSSKILQKPPVSPMLPENIKTEPEETDNGHKPLKPTLSDTVRMGPLLDLATDQVRKEISNTCQSLSISPNPRDWSKEDVRAWLLLTSQQSLIPMSLLDLDSWKWNMDGAGLVNMTENDFKQRLPNGHGEKLFTQLDIWRTNYTYDQGFASSHGYQAQANQPVLPRTCGQESQAFNVPPPPYPDTYWSPPETSQQGDDTFEDIAYMIQMIDNSTTGQHMGTVGSQPVQSPPPPYPHSQTPLSPPVAVPKIELPADPMEEDEDEEEEDAEVERKSPTTRTGTNIHLWQFVKELLLQPQNYGNYIHWVDRQKGIFKIVDSVKVATLWGKRKNRPAMNYDKLSRSLRQYYKKGIMKKTERSQRLVYQFCHPYHM